MTFVTADAANIQVLVRRLKRPTVASFLGQPEAGKSHLIRYLLLALLQINAIVSIIIFSRLDNGDYAFMEDKKRLVFRPNFKSDKDYKDYMRAVMHAEEQAAAVRFAAGDHRLTIFVFDDPGSNLPKSIADIITTHRWRAISIWTVGRRMQEIIPQARDQCDVACMFRQTSRNVLDMMWKSFGNGIDKQDWMQAVTNLPKSRLFLVYEKNVDGLRKMQAGGVPQFKVTKAPR